jgi:transposase
MKKRHKTPTPASGPRPLELAHDELVAIVERAEPAVGAEDAAKLRAVVETLGRVTAELERKGTSIARLRAMLFGARTEHTRDVLEENGRPSDDAETGAKNKRPRKSGVAAKPAKGHGRNGADDYVGAKRTKVTHEALASGDSCPAPGCTKGRVYAQAEPKILVRVRGVAPLDATVYECDRLRCNLCGEVFTAEAPPGVGSEKYDATAASMVALLKYGSGLPFYRIAKLEKSLGIPLPVATQWDVVNRAADRIAPTYAELIRQAAQGDLLHNDDTGARILSLMSPEARAEILSQPSEDDLAGRTGMFTSGIVSVGGGHRIALFLTGRRHAGENLATVLAQRAADLAAPIQMCDGLDRNVPAAFETILANCLAHARRKYVDVVDHFPEECRYVLETLREVYATDATAREQGLTAEERLQLHQTESGPRMEALLEWMKAQIEERRVEPNSGLGAAIAYMTKRWDKLTLFLRVAGVPLDNNEVERILEKAILHRKNALFYKTENGARVGDLYMSLIHTAELCGANPFDYLVALQRHEKIVAADPGRWMPWNYTDALATVTSDETTPDTG